MKKILMFILILGMWTATCGFTSADTALFKLNNGQILERICYKYDDDTILALETIGSLEEKTIAFETKLTDIGDKIKNYIIPIISNKIDSNDDYTNNEKIDIKDNHIGVNVVLDIKNRILTIDVSYSSSTIYKIFTVSDEVITQTQTNNFFTKTVKEERNIIMSQYTIDFENKYLYEIVDNKLQYELKLKYGILAVNNVMPNEFSYSYVVNSGRLHSNATEGVFYDFSTGLYYHTWKFDKVDETTISLWKTSANVITWYVLSLVLTLGFAVTMVIVANCKKKKELK